MKNELVIGSSYLIFGYRLEYFGQFTTVDEALEKCPNKVGFYIVRDDVYVRHFTTQKYEHLKNMATKCLVKKLATDREVVKRPKIRKDSHKLEINQDDNHLKIFIKNIINREEIDIRDLRDKFISDNHMNNLKRLLTGDVNMSWEKYIEWLEILDYDYSMDIFKKN